MRPREIKPSYSDDRGGLRQPFQAACVMGMLPPQRAASVTGTNKLSLSRNICCGSEVVGGVFTLDTIVPAAKSPLK